MVISAAQLRAARGLLDWTRADLARASGLSPETIKNIEHGIFKPTEATTQAIVNTFEINNVAFTDNDGVKKSESLLKTFSGPSGYIGFLEDIMETMKDGGKTCQFNFSDSIISTHGGAHLDKYNEAMQSIPNLESRCLVPEGDTFFPVKHCAYRWLKKASNTSIPYYLYGNKIAMLASAPEQEMQWVVICSPSLAAAHHKQFDKFWGESLPIINKKAQLTS